MDANPRTPSVLDAIESALGHTRRICFEPFDLSKWFVLGFCAFLAQLGQGGGGYTGGNPLGARGREDLTDTWIPWVTSHLAFVLAIVAVALVIGIALWALFLWIGSRGDFMFLDGVAKNRGAVSEPWNRFREAGDSLFKLRLVIGLAGMAVVLGVVAVALALAWPAIRGGAFTARALAAVVAGACIIAPVAIVLVGLQLVIRDFVVPIMYKRGTAATASLIAFKEVVLPGRVVPFLLFYAMFIAIGIASGILMLIGMCLTCCVAALPYLSSVVFLPVFVFFRCYALCFLQQVAPEWTILPPKAGEVPAPVGPPSAPDESGPEASPPSSEEPPVEPAAGGDVAPATEGGHEGRPIPPPAEPA